MTFDSAVQVFGSDRDIKLLTTVSAKKCTNRY
jgi:hypothetical protein